MSIVTTKGLTYTDKKTQLESWAISMGYDLSDALDGAQKGIIPTLYGFLAKEAAIPSYWLLACTPKEIDTVSTFMTNLKTYASKEGVSFTSSQWEEVRIGLEEGLDVSVYANPVYVVDQMRQLMQGLLDGVDAACYANPSYDYEQMDEIRKGLVSGIDVSLYAQDIYDAKQMYQIRKGLEAGLDVSGYLNPSLPSDVMAVKRFTLRLNDYVASAH